MRRWALTISLVVASLWETAPGHAQPGPYRLNTWTEVTLAGATAGIVAGAFASVDAQEPLTPEEIAVLDPVDVNWFDRPATEQWSTGAANASSVLAITVAASPLVLATAEFRRGDAVTLGLMYIETMLLTAGTTQLIKGTTNRIRPYVYNSDPAVPDEEKLSTHARRSFPSGHTSTAFAAAVFLSSTYARLHPQSTARTWVWIGSLTAATAVGYSRYKAGKHFLTDVFAGALIGAAFGYVVPKIHEIRAVQVAPSPGGLAVGASLKF